jgi:hypothetical protein
LTDAPWGECTARSAERALVAAMVRRGRERGALERWERLFRLVAEQRRSRQEGRAEI